LFLSLFLLMIRICWTILTYLDPCKYSSMVNDLSDMLLDSVYHYFIEDFCINIH
jgi:putative lipase involved disintegration of autophagic bodies